MHSSVALSLLAVLPAVRGLGQAVIENRCSFPVYVWSVSNSDGQMYTVDAHNGNWTESYRTNPNGGGVSIKVSRDQSQSQITQFEYTLDNTLWYDVSNINGYPFEDWGLNLVPSESGCRNIECAAGVESCSGVYNVPSDNHATAACSTDADTTLVLCSDDASPSDNDAGAAVSSVVSNVAAAASPVLQQVEVAAPSASPATTPAPAAPADDNNNDSGAVTTFLTQWVTVDSNGDASAAAATPAPAVAPAEDDDSGAQWFGHYQAGWSPKKARRHVHHPHINHGVRA